MFIPIDRLPQFSPAVRAKYETRWEDTDGQALRETVLKMIRVGAGEDFLQQEFEAGRLGFLENMWDLRGLNIFDEKLNFPSGDTFENIDFAYSQFWHSTFENAVFMTGMEFVRVFNCEFRRCIFVFNHAYGASFEKCKFIECEFVEANSFRNCTFRDVEFRACFMPKRVFFDCAFDRLSRLSESPQRPYRMNADSFTQNLVDQFDVLEGIEESYRGGAIADKARDYFFKKMQAFTRHNTSGPREQAVGFLKEFATGYGVRPMRVLAIMCVYLIAVSLLFAKSVGLNDGVILASGAIFTFGARADLLSQLGVLSRALYVVSAFMGVSFTALFVTLLASVHLRDE